MNGLHFDTLTDQERADIKDMAGRLAYACLQALSCGDGDQGIMNSSMDAACIAADQTLRSLGYFDYMFPPNEFKWGVPNKNIPPRYIWELYS